MFPIENREDVGHKQVPAQLIYMWLPFLSHLMSFFFPCVERRSIRTSLRCLWSREALRVSEQLPRIGLAFWTSGLATSGQGEL